MTETPLPSGLTELIDLVVGELPTSFQKLPTKVVEEGSAHVVVLLGQEAAVRVSRDKLVGARMVQRQKLVDGIPRSIGLSLPWSLSPVIEHDGFSAVATEFISGEPCPAGEGAPEELTRLIETVSSVDVTPIRSLLAQPLSFCGGKNWYQIQVEEVLPRIDPHMRDKARQAIDSLANLDPEELVFSHGDLGGHNVFWKNGKVTGVLDWDLASESDRSTDIASLGVWHGWEKLSQIISAEQVRRAQIRRNTFRLQQIAFLVCEKRPETQIHAAAERATAWIRENLT